MERQIEKSFIKFTKSISEKKCFDRNFLSSLVLKEIAAEGYRRQWMDWKI